MGPAKRNYTTKGVKICNTNKVAKHPSNRPIVMAKHPSPKRTQTNDGGGKAFARAAQRQNIRQSITNTTWTM
jgi:hypothetical protein